MATQGSRCVLVNLAPEDTELSMKYSGSDSTLGFSVSWIRKNSVRPVPSHFLRSLCGFQVGSSYVPLLSLFSVNSVAHYSSILLMLLQQLHDAIMGRLWSDLSNACLCKLWGSQHLPAGGPQANLQPSRLLKESVRACPTWSDRQSTWKLSPWD